MHFCGMTWLIDELRDWLQVGPLIQHGSASGLAVLAVSGTIAATIVITAAAYMP